MASTRPQDFGSAAAAQALALASTLTKRRPERARLLDWLAGLDQGVGRLVLVSGASGTGKSKLLAELETTARDNGAHRVLVLDGARGRHPLRPLQRLIAELGELAPEAEQARFSKWQQAPLGQGDLASEPSARRHHYEEIARAITTVATAKPVVLIFADLEELDPTIQELFDYLAERLFGDGASRVLLVGSGRVGRALPSSVSAETLTLQPLDDDAIRDLLTSPEVVRFFAETTGGQLSTLVAMLHHLPNNLSSLFATRLDRLSDPARFVLELLALSAGELSMEDMLFAFSRTGRSPDALRGAVSELQTARLVESRAQDGMLVFALCERAERETVVAGLPDESARHTHLLLADIARRHREHEGNRVEYAVVEAEHLIAAGAGDRAVEAALAAADGLRQMAAPHRAIALYRRAAELTPDETLRSEIDRRLHALELDTGDYQAALESAERIRRRQPGAAAWLLVARTHLVRDEHAQAKDALLHGLQAGPDPSERGELGALLAEAHYLGGDRTAATLVATEALAAAPSVAQSIELCNTLGKVHLASGDLDAAAAAFATNITAAQTASLPREECRARFNAGIVELQRGDRTAAEAAYRAALAIADRTGDTRNRAFVLQNLAVLRHWSSDFTDAIALFREAIAAFRQLGQRARLAWLAHDLSSVYLDLGDLVQAESLVQLGERYAAAAPSVALDIDRMMLRGRLAILAEDLPRAASVLEEAAARADESGDRSRARQARLLLAEAAIDTGRVDAPATQRTFARATSGNPAPREQAAVAYLEGRWKLASGDIAGAIEALTQATRLAEGLPDLDLAWKALFALADAQHQDRPAWAPKRDRRKPSPHVRRLLERADALWHRVAQPLSDELRASYAKLPARRRLIEMLHGSETVAPLATTRTAASTAPLPAPVLASVPLPVSPPTRPFRLVGEHPKLLSALALIDKVAPFDSPVLIRGESGTGKELVADEIWARSPRDQKPIVKVNCGALVESLLLSELFGHEKGAFTGAHARKKGCFETAHGGTLFLDEIGDISPKTQVALLRVLQEREFLRVGGNEPVKVDVRLIFATHRNLEEMVGKGLFREDLYYRLRGIQIELPPLRERPSDVVLLARALLDKIARERGEAARTLDPEAEALCRAHRWPGNVRELDNTLRSVSLFAESTVITAHELLRYSDLGRGRTTAVATPTEPGPSTPSFTRLQEERISLRELKTQIEIECIGKALRETRGNITRAAEKLGMKRPRLSQLIKQYGISLGEGVESLKESV